MMKTNLHQWRWLYGIIGIIVIPFALLVADYFLYPRFSKIGGRSLNTGQNAS